MVCPTKRAGSNLAGGCGFSPPSRIVLAATVLSLILCAACQRATVPALKRYPFTGRIVSRDEPTQSAVIDGDAIPGFMGAMAMPYKIKSLVDFKQLSVGDSISAEVVVESKDKGDVPDYWVENVKVTAHATAPAQKPTAEHRLPAPGQQVPDFQFTNQNDRRISLRQYRGKVLFVTFIYTRCPFPDYCPRVTAQFARLHQQLAADPSLSPRTHLLCISFDPAHDTPRVLRDYGFSLVHSRQSELFDGWEFAVPGAAALPQIALYFALDYKPQGGLLAHSLATAVIGPDGKIVNWYSGSDWHVSDLVKDATDALHAPV